jgi:DNA-binding LacI/PurR family transcriptional regulator
LFKAGVRLRDIAEKAGVSVSTVSLVLNEKTKTGNVRISEKTIQHVRQIAGKMDYFPNLPARAMLNGQTTIVGLILEEIRYSASQLPLIQGISEVLKRMHYSLATGLGTKGDVALEKQEIQMMNRKGFDCLIIEPTVGFMGYAHRDIFRDPNRVILINRPSVAGLSSVMIDHIHGAYLATKHLLDLGHQRVAFAGVHCSISEIESKSYEEIERTLFRRFFGYLKAVSEYDVVPVVVNNPEEIFDLEEPVTGVFCANSWGAADLIGVCWDRGIRVPDDLSIVGQDDAREKSLVRPRLTTVDVRPWEVGGLAAEMALDAMSGKLVTDRVLEPRLIVRESTGPVTQKHTSSRSESVWMKLANRA